MRIKYPIPTDEQTKHLEDSSHTDRDRELVRWYLVIVTWYFQNPSRSRELAHDGDDGHLTVISTIIYERHYDETVINID